MNVFNLGEWKSAYRDMQIKFNNNVWWLIPNSYDGDEGSLFGVLDRNDGSSISIDFSLISDDEVYEYEWCESEYYFRLYNISNSTREIDRFELIVGDVAFKCVSYSFDNKQFGEQVVVRGMVIGNSAVAGLSMAWPSSLISRQGEVVPPKHTILLQEFKLNVELNA